MVPLAGVVVAAAVWTLFPAKSLNQLGSWGRLFHLPLLCKYPG